MNRKHLAQHLLFHLVRAQLGGQRLELQELVDLVKVRRGDVRATLTVLHQQGLYNVLRRSLTLVGFGLGVKLAKQQLPELRPAKVAQVVAA
jgi:DNA-binding GntR family transcriptional regulator